MLRIKQWCSSRMSTLSWFLFNFLIDDIMKQALQNSATTAPDAHRNKILFDSEYADDIICSLKTFAQAQLLLDSLIHSAAGYGLKVASSKCKLMLFKLTGTTQPLLMEREGLEQIDKFTNLGNCISANGRIAEKISARIAKLKLLSPIYATSGTVGICRSPPKVEYIMPLSANAFVNVWNAGITFRGRTSSWSIWPQISWLYGAFRPEITIK